MNLYATADLYLAFSSALSYPDDREKFNNLVEILSKNKLKNVKKIKEILDTLSDDDLKEFYTNKFDVGLAGPSCPLYEGHYSADRVKVFEDLLRFYEYFDLKPKGNEQPDHICVELECIYYLTVLEIIVRERGENSESIRRAKKDFIKRHLLEFVGMILERLKGESKAEEFYRLIFNILREILEEEIKE